MNKCMDIWLYWWKDENNKKYIKWEKMWFYLPIYHYKLKSLGCIGI